LRINNRVKVVDEPESGPEFVAELVSLQEDIFSQPRVVELPIETLVDLPTEPTMELVPSLIAMRTSLLFRSPDEHDPLQMSTKDKFTKDYATYSAKFSQFSFHHG